MTDEEAASSPPPTGDAVATALLHSLLPSHALAGAWREAVKQPLDSALASRHVPESEVPLPQPHEKNVVPPTLASTASTVPSVVKVPGRWVACGQQHSHSLQVTVTV